MSCNYHYSRKIWWIDRPNAKLNLDVCNVPAALSVKFNSRQSFSAVRYYNLYPQVGNAETEGYTIVVGVGATMVIYSAVSAITERILDVNS